MLCIIIVDILSGIKRFCEIQAETSTLKNKHTRTNTLASDLDVVANCRRNFMSWTVLSSVTLPEDHRGGVAKSDDDEDDDDTGRG
jgi:hypothetical protein